MHLRGLTALIGCWLLCTTAFAVETPLLYDFAPGGNAAGHPSYDGERGFGFEVDAPTRKFSVRLPEGNYRVTLDLGGKRHRTHARVLAEQRRLMLETDVVDEVQKRSFIVNVRTAELAAVPGECHRWHQGRPQAARTRQRHLGRQAHARVCRRCARGRGAHRAV